MRENVGSDEALRKLESVKERKKNVESDKDPRKLESVRERKKTMEGVVIDERVCD